MHTRTENQIIEDWRNAIVRASKEVKTLKNNHKDIKQNARAVPLSPKYLEEELDEHLTHVV